MRISALISGIVLALLSALPAVAADAPRDVMIVLDNSGSMRNNDPARLSLAAVTDFIRKQSGGTRVGIVVFADTPRLAQPLTPVNDDTRGNLLGALDSLDFNGQWTDTASAVERALYELRVNGRADADQAIVLMTDGIIDTGNAQRDLEKGRWLRDQLAGQARDNDVRVFGIAFTENADYQLLQSLAQATDGDYFRTLNARDIAPALARIDRVLSQPLATQSPPEDFVTSAPREPVAVLPEPERLVFTPPSQPAASNTPANAGTPPATQTQSTTAETEESNPWRWVLMLLALLVLGAVAVAMFWGEEAARLLKRAAPRLRRPPEDHGPKAVLYDVYDPSDIKRHELGAKPVVIGRVSGSDPAMDYIVVDERTVGRWHATLERRGQSFWIRDEGSVNGTFVNDQRVTAEHPLKHGDMVRVHRHEFEFVIPELFDSDRTMISPEAKVKRVGEAAEGV